MSRAESGGTGGATATAVRRERLNRDRVLRAAVELADESGIAAVSMRGLAKDLGVVPMALYKHVADKDELLDGMVDILIDEFAHPAPDLIDAQLYSGPFDAGLVGPGDPGPTHSGGPDPGGPGADGRDPGGRGAGGRDPGRADSSGPDSSRHWKDRIRQRILAARRTVLRHPWARQAIESRTTRTPAVLGYMDSLAGEFRAAGFSADLTHHVMHAIGNRIWGFSPELFEEPRPDEPPDQPSPDPQALAAMEQEFAARYPNILAIALASTNGDLSRVGTGCDEQFEFEFALDLLLDGAERLHRQGWQSRNLVVNANKPTPA